MRPNQRTPQRTPLFAGDEGLSSLVSMSMCLQKTSTAQPIQEPALRQSGRRHASAVRKEENISIKKEELVR